MINTSDVIASAKTLRAIEPDKAGVWLEENESHAERRQIYRLAFGEAVVVTDSDDESAEVVRQLQAEGYVDVRRQPGVGAWNGPQLYGDFRAVARIVTYRLP